MESTVATSTEVQMKTIMATLAALISNLLLQPIANFFFNHNCTCLLHQPKLEILQNQVRATINPSPILQHVKSTSCTVINGDANESDCSNNNNRGANGRIIGCGNISGGANESDYSNNNSNDNANGAADQRKTRAKQKQPVSLMCERQEEKYSKQKIVLL